VGETVSCICGASVGDIVGGGKTGGAITGGRSGDAVGGGTGDSVGGGISLSIEIESFAESWHTAPFGGRASTWIWAFSSTPLQTSISLSVWSDVDSPVETRLESSPSSRLDVTFSMVKSRTVTFISAGPTLSTIIS
jgi:hypothetical protein